VLVSGELVVSLGLVVSTELVVSVLLIVPVVLDGELAVTTQEHADEIREGISWHCETNAGRPVVAVCKAIV
jgi:hypothetical protein